jgi:hypothetical protein
LLIRSFFGKFLLGAEAKSRRISSGFLNSPLPRDFSISSGNGTKSKPLSQGFDSKDIKPVEQAAALHTLQILDVITHRGPAQREFLGTPWKSFRV